MGKKPAVRRCWLARLQMQMQMQMQMHLHMHLDRPVFMYLRPWMRMPIGRRPIR